MQLTQKRAVIFLMISLLLTTNSSYTSNPHIDTIKALKKAWKSSWVKAGAIASSSALAYALYTSHQHNQKLFWGLISILSALTTGACGYLAYYSLNDDTQDSSENNDDSQATLALDEDFFDFPESELDNVPKKQIEALMPKKEIVSPVVEPVEEVAVPVEKTEPVKEVVATTVEDVIIPVEKTEPVAQVEEAVVQTEDIIFQTENVISQTEAVISQTEAIISQTEAVVAQTEDVASTIENTNTEQIVPVEEPSTIE